MSKCMICNGTYTAKEVYLLKDWKTDRTLCQLHINEVVNMMKNEKVER